MFSDISDEKSHQLIVILLYKSKIEPLGSDCHWIPHVQPLFTFLLLTAGKHHSILNWYESTYFFKKKLFLMIMFQGDSNVPEKDFQEL